jgi:hypothetical protein|tara:strand:+ start:5241 stop:5393 length:153 start_codon:yes stop_codon:yes gene_type:complete
MIKLIKKVWNAIRPRTQAQQEYDYLANSHDLQDLERRQRVLMNKNLKGWV